MKKLIIILLLAIGVIQCTSSDPLKTIEGVYTPVTVGDFINSVELRGHKIEFDEGKLYASAGKQVLMLGTYYHKNSGKYKWKSGITETVIWLHVVSGDTVVSFMTKEDSKKSHTVMSVYKKVTSKPTNKKNVKVIKEGEKNWLD